MYQNTYEIEGAYMVDNLFDEFNEESLYGDDFENDDAEINLNQYERLLDLKDAIEKLNKTLMHLGIIDEENMYTERERFTEIENLTFYIEQTELVLKNKIPVIQKLLKAKGGRPTRKTKRDIEQIESFAEEGMSLNEINKLLPHLSRSTIQRVVGDFKKRVYHK